MTHLVLTRRFGWQCLPGLWGNGCYDGPIQRDEMHYIPRPGEGTRMTPAPTYDLATMGIEPGQRESLESRFRDHATGVVWVLGDGTIEVSSDQSSPSHGGWIYSSDYRLWIQDSVMYIGGSFPEVYKYIPVPTNSENYEFEAEEVVEISP